MTSAEESGREDQRRLEKKLDEIRVDDDNSAPPKRQQFDPPRITPFRMSCFIPVVAPSMNALIQVIWHQRRFITHPDVSLFRTRFKEFLPPWQPPVDCLFNLTLTFHQPWYTQQRKIKRQDVGNLTKCTEDAIFEHYGIDDSRVWERRAIKADSATLNGTHIDLEVRPHGS